MNVKHHTIQLTLKEQPNAFDYNTWHDAVVVGTQGSVSFFRIADNGTPHQLFYYDQCRQSSTIRVQCSEQSMIACLYGRELTLWDPSKPISPMTKTLMSQSCISDFRWSKEDNNIFAMALSSGIVSTWDLRTASKPVHQLMLGKECQKLEWCHNDPNLLAISAENKYVVVWDVRMLPGVNGRNIDECYAIVEPEGGLSDFTWASACSTTMQPALSSKTTDSSKLCGQDRSNTSPFLWSISQKSKILELIRISKNKLGFHPCFELSHPSANFVENMKVVAHPQGNGVVLYHQDENATKFRYLETRHHQSVDLEVPLAKTCSQVLGCAWRSGQHGSYSSQESSNRSFVSFTSNGQLQIIDWPRRKLSSSWDDRAATKGRTPSSLSLDNIAHGSNTANKSRSKFSIKKLKSSMGQNSFKDEMDLTSSSLQAPNRSVVGPKTFLLLIREELAGLDACIRHSNPEGVRVGAIDQFTRQIVLEVLIPIMDSFTISNFTTNYNSHYRNEELNDFYAKGAAGRTVNLTITFPIKTSQFWHPKFALDNKSHIAFDMDNLSLTIITELQVIARARTYNKAQHSDGSASARSHDNSIDLLLPQIAKVLSKKVLKSWEKKTDGDRISFSFGSFKQSHENVSNVRPQAERNSDEMHNMYLKYVEACAFHVPFPVVSAGIFNGKGELVLFGNAQLQTKHIQPRSTCRYVDNIPATAYPIVREDYSNELPEKDHKSYAYLMVNKYIKKTTSEGMLSTISSLNGMGSTGSLNNLNTSTISPRMNLNPIDSKTGKILIPGLDFDRDEDDDALDEEMEGDDDDDDEDDEEGDDEDEEDEDESEDEEGNEDDVDRTDEDEVMSDYEPGYDFEEKEEEKGYIQNLAIKTPSPAPLVTTPGRRVSYTETSSPIADLHFEEDDATAGSASRDLLPVRKYSNMSDYSNSPYFVAEIDLKSSDHSSVGRKATTNEPRHPVEITVYRCQYKAEKELAHYYNFGPMKNFSSWYELNERVAACRFNVHVVERIMPKNRGLSQFWSLLAVALDVYTIVDSGGLISWNNSVLGRSTFVQLISYLSKTNDVQTWATAISVIGGSKSVLGLLAPSTHMIFAGRKEFDELMKSKVASEIAEMYLEQMIYRYAQMLQKWGEGLKAAEVLSRMAAVVESSSNKSSLVPISKFQVLGVKEARLELNIACIFCGGEIHCRSDANYATAVSNAQNRRIQLDTTRAGANSNRSGKAENRCFNNSKSQLWCLPCNIFGIYCSVCLLPVRGMASICELCGHGGHEDDMVQWFNKYDDCPTGCGCKCRSTEEDVASDDEEVVQFEEEESELLSLSPERNYRNSSNNIAAGYHSSNAMMANSKAKGSAVFNNSLRIVNQPHYLEALSSNINSAYNYYNNFFTDFGDM